MSGLSTTDPSPTSTVFQPDMEQGPDTAGPSRIRSREEKLPDNTVSSGEKDRPRNRNDSRPVRPEKAEMEDWTVKWDGPEDPGCPLNTPPWRKWYVPPKLPQVWLS
jgi:hypothetical protein